MIWKAINAWYNFIQIRRVWCSTLNPEASSLLWGIVVDEFFFKFKVNENFIIVDSIHNISDLSNCLKLFREIEIIKWMSNKFHFWIILFLKRLKLCNNYVVELNTMSSWMHFHEALSVIGSTSSMNLLKQWWHWNSMY